MPDQLQKALDRLVEDGTLSPAQAEKVGQALRAAGVAPPQEESAGPPEDRRARAGEVLSYVGGALVVGALTLIVGLGWDELGRSGRIMICGAATVLLLAAAFLAGRPSARRNPAAASALAGLGAAGAAVTAGVADTSRTVLLPGIVLLVVSVAAYVFWKGIPLLLAMFAGGGLILLDLLDRQPDSWPDSRVYAVVFLAYGALWILLGYVLRHGWTAGALGSLTVFVGAEIGAFDNRYPVLGLIFGVVVIAALFTLFWRRRNWAYAIFGVLTALVVPSTALGRIWENALIGAVVLLVVGAALVVAAVLSGVRGRGARGAGDAPGGRGGGEAGDAHGGRGAGGGGSTSS